MSIKRLVQYPIPLLCLCAGACLMPQAWIVLPAAAVLTLWLPGWLLVQLLRPLSNTSGRAWIALALSLLITPLVLHLVWTASNGKSAVLAGIVLLNVSLLLAARWRNCAYPPVSSLLQTARQRALVAAVVAWSAGLTFCVYWVPVAGGRLVPVPSGDYVKHHAIVWSLVNNPLPLHNMFYAGEAGTPYYYYEHAYLIPAAFCVLTGKGISIQTAFGLAAAAVTASFLGMVLLVARSVIGSGRGALLAVVCASLVGGFDVVPILLRLRVSPTPLIMDGWCPTAWRIHNLMNDYVWCPQHVAAAGAFLLCVHLLQQAPRAAWWIVLAPLAALAIFGSSVYHAMLFLPLGALYGLMVLRKAAGDPRDRPGRLLGAFALMAIVSLAIMLPRALQYREMARRYQGGLTLRWDRFDYACFGRLVAPGPLANLLDAPWMLLVDFGIGAVAALLVARVVWRRCWLDEGVRLLMMAGAVGAALMWVVRSNVNAYDYGFRLASMPAQVLGAILVGFLLEPGSLRPVFARFRKPVLIAGLLLGLPVGLYEAPGLALRTFVERLPESAEQGAARFVREHLPERAVLQACPLSGSGPFSRSLLPQLTDRQMGILEPSDPHINVLSARDKPAMRQMAERVDQAFRSDAAAAHDLLLGLGVTHVFVGIRERKRYGETAFVADTRYFRKLYGDGQAAVYELTDGAATRPAAP
jgi:hypothetical protein